MNPSKRDRGNGCDSEPKRVRDDTGCTSSIGTVASRDGEQAVEEVQPVVAQSRTLLAGQTFVMTGTFPDLGGGEGLDLGKLTAKKMMQSFGARVTSAVSGKTSFVLVGKAPGAKKLEAAEKKGVKIVSLEQLQLALESKSQVIALAALKAAEQPILGELSKGYTHEQIKAKSARADMNQWNLIASGSGSVLDRDFIKADALAPGSATVNPTTPLPIPFAETTPGAPPSIVAGEQLEILNEGRPKPVLDMVQPASRVPMELQALPSLSKLVWCNECGNRARNATTGCCTVHGGGYKCTANNLHTGKACGNKANVNSGLCQSHSPVVYLRPRCKHFDSQTGQGCAKGALDTTTGLCSLHGGGPRCKHFDSLTRQACAKGALDTTTGLCCLHGGGLRCAQACCIKVLEGMIPTIATGTHPVNGTAMCTFAMRVMVDTEEDSAKKLKLQVHFGFKRLLAMRGEHAFYHALCMLVPDLKLSERVLDDSVMVSQGKPKSNTDLRPDFFHYFGNSTNDGFTIHAEYDEIRGHEDDDERLKEIAVAAGVDFDKTYVIRVSGKHYTKDAVCTKMTFGYHSYYKLTDAGHKVVKETAAVVKERLRWISLGLGPDDSQNRKRKVYINF